MVIIGMALVFISAYLTKNNIAKRKMQLFIQQYNSMIIPKGHEYVERSARKKGIEFTKEDNCIVSIPNAPALDCIADSMISNNRDAGQLIIKLPPLETVA